MEEKTPNNKGANSMSEGNIKIEDLDLQAIYAEVLANQQAEKAKLQAQLKAVNKGIQTTLKAMHR